MLGFAAGTLLVSAVLVVTTFLLARGYLLEQRERALTRQAFADADLLRTRLSTAGTEIGTAVGELELSSPTEVVVHSGDAWYSSSLEVGARDVPASLQAVVTDGAAGSVRSGGPTAPRLVVGVSVPSAGLEFYEVTPLLELEQVLRTLAAVLGAGAGAATAAGTAFGWWASRRAVQPLEQVAGAAARIAGGDLGTRLPATRDPDLVAIVGSFNAMVDALAARIDRDARFVGDVSHELRSPLTSLVTSVSVMAARRDELPPRSRQALALVEAELGRFRQTLDDLLELARMDSGTPDEPAPPVAVADLAREVLVRTGRDPALLLTDGDPAGTRVAADKGRLERALRNLLDNADRHGDGVRRVEVLARGGTVLLSVDDAGPGVPAGDRERVFERFARSASSARGSRPGAGLGLAIVAETAAHAGGTAWVTDGPCGGARVTLSLPREEP
ncbi:sensor histidine kinase [Geodermatophilus nigrescens]